MSAAGAGQITVAFLGCGQATAMHSRTLASLDPAVRRAYASRDPARAAAYRDRFAGVRAYDSYQAACDDPSVTAVFIATPPRSHLELVRSAFQAGRHAIVEKPPFVSTTEFDQARAAATAAGRRLYVAENYFYKPLATRLRTWIADGSIGEPRLLLVNALKSQHTSDWRDDPREAGGGALFEGGIHWVSLLANLGLTVQSLRAFRVGGRVGLDRSMLVTVTYDGGAVASLAFSWETRSSVFGLRLSRIYGTEGSIAFESNGVAALLVGRRTRLSIPGLRDLPGYRAMFRDILGALREERDAAYTPALARRDLALVEAAYASLGA
jgi:predicted dehydrogenase